MAFRWSSESVVVDHKDLQANTMAIDHAGKHVVLAGRRNVAIIDTEKPNEVLKRIARSHQKYDVMAADWNPTSHMGHTFALAVGEKAEIWRWNEGMLSTEITLKSHIRTISDLHWHRTEPNLLVTCSIDTYLYIWDVREARRSVMSFSAIAGASRVKWNPINANVLASAHDSDMRIWDRRKVNQPISYINAHLQKINGLDWSPNHENQLVSSSSDSTVKFFNITNPRANEMQINLPNPVWRARYTPFGEGIVTVVVPPLRRGDNSLLLWSLSDASNPVHTFVGHSDVVLEFDWRIIDANMSEIQLVTWSRDNSLRIWRLDPQILKMCGHSFDEDDVTDDIEVESSDTDTLLGSVPCQDELLMEDNDKESIQVDNMSDVESLPFPSSMSDRLKREPPKTLSLSDVILHEGISPDPIFTLMKSPSAKLSDYPAGSQSLQVATAVSSLTELSSLSFNFEKTPETSVEVIIKEESKQCVVNFLHLTFVAILEIKLPMNYPKSQPPSFRFCPGSNIDGNTKKELLKILRTTAAQYLKKKKNCLDQCIKIFINKLKALLTEEKIHGVDNMANMNYVMYGGQHDYSIPFPRTSGARFGSSGILVCFTHPNRRYSYQRSSRTEPSTPRSLSAAYSSTNNKYNSYLYSGQNSSMDKPMYYNQESGRNSKHKRGKSDGDGSRIGKTGMITIYDISKFIPISKELAIGYIFDETDKIACCHKNRDVAMTHGKTDIAQVWSIVASIMTLAPDNGEKEGNPWAYNPLVRKLISSLIDNYLSKHDVQTAAMLSCILGKRPQVIKPQPNKKGRNTDSSTCTGGSPYNTIHGTNTEGLDVGCIIRHNRSNSEGSLSEASRPISENGPLISKDNVFTEQKTNLGFLDPDKSNMYDEIRKAYSEILFRWDLLEQKTLVDKYRRNVPPMQKGIDFQIECSSCYQSSPLPQCIHCKHSNFTCSICTLSVRGSSIVCIICGHGGHSLHIIDWFQSESACPTGCGCECLIEMEQLFCNS